MSKIGENLKNVKINHSGCSKKGEREHERTCGHGGGTQTSCELDLVWYTT